MSHIMDLTHCMQITTTRAAPLKTSVRGLGGLTVSVAITCNINTKILPFRHPTGAFWPRLRRSVLQCCGSAYQQLRRVSGIAACRYAAASTHECCDAVLETLHFLGRRPSLALAQLSFRLPGCDAWFLSSPVDPLTLVLAGKALTFTAPDPRFS
jgi:hypothetical protein